MQLMWYSNSNTLPANLKISLVPTWAVYILGLEVPAGYLIYHTLSALLTNQEHKQFDTLVFYNSYLPNTLF